MITIYNGLQKHRTLFVYLFLVCFLHVNFIHGLTFRQINEKLGHIEDRINAENKFRRDDFNTLFNEISSIKEMMQSLLGTNTDEMEIKHTDKAGEDITKELEEKILRLNVGFKEEKKTNVRLRRQTQELYRKVTDLKTTADKNTDALEMLVNNVEIIMIQLNLFQEEISEIKINVQNLTVTFDHTQKEDELKLDTLQTYTENIKEQLKNKQMLCLKTENITNKVAITEEEKIGNKKVNSEEKKICSCSNVSFLEQSTPSPEKTFTFNNSCMDLYNNGIKSNGIYQIDIGEGKPLSVYCDMETDGGGWTVFQRRQDGSVDFFRDWNAYKYGFGTLNGELWLGNKYLNLLTDDGKEHELRIDLEDFEGNHAYAKYQNFMVLSEGMKYMLEVSGYTGNAGDSLKDTPTKYGIHNKMKFTTKDDDNDKYYSRNCALLSTGGWWFNDCFASHLNGPYSQGGICETALDCIIWDTWGGWKVSMKLTEMKLR